MKDKEYSNEEQLRISEEQFENDDYSSFIINSDNERVYIEEKSK